MIQCLLHVWLPLQLTKYVWQNIASFYASLGLNTPESLKKQAQTQDPTHTLQVRLLCCKHFIWWLNLPQSSPQHCRAQQAEEGWVIPLGNFYSVHSDLCIPSPVAQVLLSSFLLRNGQDSELDRKSLATLGAVSPFTQVSPLKPHLSVIKTHSQWFFSKTE